MIKLTGLSKKYGKTFVVKDADALFPKGEVTSIIGPNGAGKSDSIVYGKSPNGE